MNDPAPDFEAQAENQIRVCKIIAGALIVGVSMFLAIVLFLRQTGGKGLLAAKPWDVAPAGAIISLIALVMMAWIVVLLPVVSKSMTTNFRTKMAAGKPLSPELSGMGEQGDLRFVYQTRMIVLFAMAEGVGFFNAIAFMLEGKLPNLIAVLVLLGVMAARFPTRGSIDAFVDEQSDILRQDRQSA